MTRALIFALVFVAMACAAVIQSLRLDVAKAAMKQQAETISQLNTTLREERGQRAEENRRFHRVQEAQDAEFIARQAAEAAARRADAVAVGLRKRVADLAAAARAASQDSEPAGRCATANATVDLLSDMLRWTDEAAGEVGRYADKARLAGQLCVGSYEALTPGAAHEQVRDLP